MELNIDANHLGWPTYSVQADNEQEYNELAAYLKANARFAPGYQGSILPWNDQDKPSLCYSTNQRIVFSGNQTCELLKGVYKCIGVTEFFGMVTPAHKAKPAMKDKKGYVIVTKQYLSDLEDKVNELIDEGYAPVGGITFVKAERYGETDKYHQPMELIYPQVRLATVEEEAAADAEEARQDAETREFLANNPEMQALMEKL
jgi:hypothetical protein